LFIVSVNTACATVKVPSAHDYELEVKFAKLWNIRASAITYARGSFAVNTPVPTTVKDGESPEFVFWADQPITKVEVYDFATGITITVNYDLLPGSNDRYSFTLDNVDGDKEIHIEF
jgi:hypothetical protein